MTRAVDPQRALHIVQIGYDDSVFREGAPSDTLNRQLQYGRELARMRPGSSMSVLMFTGNGEARAFRQENVTLVPVRPKGPLGLPALYRGLAALHREHRIDVIGTQSVYEDAWIALIFGKLRSIKVVGQVHNDFFSPMARREMLGGGPIGRARAIVGSALLRQLHAVRVVGTRTRDRMLSERLHTDVHVIPVPVTMMHEANDLPESGTPRLNVLFVGRLVPEKNMEDWLRTAALVASRHPTVEFDIVGDGPLRSHVEEKVSASKLEDRFHFQGFIPYSSLPSVYRSSAVFLLTSHCEGAPRVVFESCFQRLPVVATRISGVEDIIMDGETGFLHAAGDVEGMAASVLALLEDATLRQRMGSAARAKVLTSFDPERLARDWMSLLVSAAR